MHLALKKDYNSVLALKCAVMLRCILSRRIPLFHQIGDVKFV
jgi:hypothetical protein